MNEPKALDLTTEWEDQCNNPIRHDVINRITGEVSRPPVIPAQQEQLLGEIIKSYIRPVHEGNDPEEWAISFHQARVLHRRSRLTLKAVWCTLGAIAFAVLFLTGLLVEWLAIPAVLVFACIASASVGRVLEGKRR